MEEEYRIVNGLKLPPKRQIVVKQKTPNSVTADTHPESGAQGNRVSTPDVGKKQNASVSDMNPPLPFGQIRDVLVEFKKKSKCKDIVLPEQPEFPEKWAALAKGIAEKIGNEPNRHDAIALIDCTILGGCEQGALIDKSGIYMVNEEQEVTGWLDWKDFIEKAEISRKSCFEISICSQPSVGLDISHCKLSVSQAHKLFATLLNRASGGKAKTSQIRAISFMERLRDLALQGIIVLICLPLAILAVWGVKSYAHVCNVEKAFAMYCQSHHLPGYRGIVSVDVPRWDMLAFGSAKYMCSAKVKVARDGQAEEIIDMTFMARRVSDVEAIVEAADTVGAIHISEDVRNARKKEGLGFSSDNWDVNMGFWGWIGDDYHIWDVKIK